MEKVATGVYLLKPLAPHRTDTTSTRTEFEE